MTYKERKEKEAYLLYLIEKGRLSSLEKVSDKFGCSKRTIRRMISNLREEGNTIYYCRVKHEYFMKK